MVYEGVKSIEATITNQLLALQKSQLVPECPTAIARRGFIEDILVHKFPYCFQHFFKSTVWREDEDAAHETRMNEDEVPEMKLKSKSGLCMFTAKCTCLLYED